MIVGGVALSLSGVLTVVILGAAGLVAGLALLRLFLVFAAAREIYDGGQRAVAPVIDRVAMSVGSRKVTMVCDLAQWSDASPSASPVALVQSLLAQRYRNLELVVVAAQARVPTDLHLAFDLHEAGTDETSLIYRSGRDERLVCIVPAPDSRGSTVDDGPEPQRFSDAVRVASGELICPISTTWDLRPLAVAELAAPWVQAPHLAGSFGTLLPSKDFGAKRLVAIRADLLATAGVGDDRRLLAGLGLLSSAHRGCIMGMLAKRELELAGGIPGPLEDPVTWAQLGETFAELGRDRRSRAAVRVVATPLGRVEGRGRMRPVVHRPASRAGAVNPGVSLLALTIGRFMPVAFGTAVLASILGLVGGGVSAQVVWVAASAPILLVAVVVLSLIVDDRALRPAGRTRLRLRLLKGAVGAGLWGVVGSPLRWTAHELH